MYTIGLFQKHFLKLNIKFSNLLTIVRNVCSYDGVGINLDNLMELEIPFQMLISPLLVREKEIVDGVHGF